MRVAIHQPNFLPWLGYIDKLTKSDIFLFLDDVQIPKKGSSWSNRVRILIGGRAQWITAPISRAEGHQVLKDVRFGDSNWNATLENTLRMAYSRASHYDETIVLLQKIFRYKTPELSDWNINTINEILKHLAIPLPKIYNSSQFNIKSASTQRLVELVNKVEGTTYLCGTGSSGYLEQGLFDNSNIEIAYQNFVEFEYPQLNTSEFIGGLSIIDTLMMLGVEGTCKLLEMNRND